MSHICPHCNTKFNGSQSYCPRCDKRIKYDGSSGEVVVDIHNRRCFIIASFSIVLGAMTIVGVIAATIYPNGFFNMIHHIVR